MTPPDWRHAIRGLADQLTGQGDLRTSVWREALCSVPRHAFVPRFFEVDGVGEFRLVDSANASQRDAWWKAVYSDQTLVTRLAEVTTAAGTYQVGSSSSTMPGLMLPMLEDLDVSEEHRILEIGTGTGYNAALLSARLGAEQVYSVDVQPDLVEVAKERLAGLGYHPTLSVGDGSDGFDAGAPYDRIIATCSVRRVPTAWIEQLRPGGLLLVDIQGDLASGNLALLRKDGDQVEGCFLTRHGRRYGAFMALRPTSSTGGSPILVEPDAVDVRERSTVLKPGVVDDWNLPVTYLAQLEMPHPVSLVIVGEDGALRTQLHASDGSWCEVSHRGHQGIHHVREAGPQQLWTIIERAFEEWTNSGMPTWNRYGFTARADHQFVWLEDSASGHAWLVP